VFAAVDVGSNTVRMLLGDVRQGKVLPHNYERRITRLRGGQTDDGLAPEAMERTLSALYEFVDIAQGHNPELISVVGTEALRSAVNHPEFLKTFQEETSLTLKVASGEEEALLSARGALSAIDPTPDHSIIIDIGGGSTEVVLVSHAEVLFKYSCPLGVVRLAELESAMDQTENINQVIAELNIAISSSGLQQFISHPDTVVIGTAGTITTLAALDLGLSVYDWRKVNNYRMRRSRIQYFLDELTPLSVREREALPGMEEGRGDLIIPGLYILTALLKLFGKEGLIVSDFGLLEGLLLQMAAAVACD